MFDRKPMIVKPSKSDMEITKEQMDNIPIWVRMVGLDVKYWGRTSLTKITGLIGKSLRTDAATTKRERLTYARVLVEVKLNHEYPTSIRFENEAGKIVEQKIHYEWKPVMCEKCRNYGHELNECPKFINEEHEKNEKKQELEMQEKIVQQNAGEGTQQGQTQIEKEEQQIQNQQGGYEQMERGRYYKQGYRTGKYARRGMIIPEEPLKIRNAFKTLEKQQNSEEESTSQTVMKLNVGMFGLLETKVKRAKAQRAALNLCSALRKSLWEEIKKINEQMRGPWAVMGYFNCVLNREDMGSQVRMSEIRDFKNCVEECELQEMKSSGAFYTWNNKQRSEDRVYSRIDRVLINTEWIIILPNSEVHYRNEGTYDHSPAIIRWAENQKR
ncbi:uncharacterized protein [Nicotiana sylvestris]|uniref:uncharacterized protein n=1 Tax=Nicotiana sylvestris TaxID=4096 RepID=UPI00388CAB0B